MSVNSDFYTDYRRFGWLIDCYARKLRDPHARGELWSFLCLLTLRDPPPPNDRYIKTALRHEYLRLAKEEKRNACAPFAEWLGGSCTLDSKLEFEELIDCLTTGQKQAVLLTLFGGYRVDELAEKLGFSRQNLHRKKKLAFAKMKASLTNCV